MDSTLMLAEAPAELDTDLLLAPDEGDQPAEGVTAGDQTKEDGGEAGAEGSKPEGADNADDEGGKPDADAKPKKPTGSERLKRRLERLEEENASLRSARQSPAVIAAPDDAKAIEASVLAEIGDPPKEDDFKDFLAYDRALAAYEGLKATATLLAKREAKANADRRATDEETSVRKLFDAHEDRLDDLEEQLPGSRAKIAKAGDTKAEAHVARALIESDKSALLQLHLCTHPNTLAELNRMPEREALKAIARLEVRLSVPKPRTETKAPAPIRPVTGGGAPPADPSRMSFAEYEAWRAKGGGR